MLQILLDHLFRHLPHPGTKIPSRPKMPPPILFLQVRKLFKQLARCASLDPPHDLAWRHRRRTTRQYMHVILAHHAFHYPDLKGFACLSYQFSNSLPHLSSQNLIPVLRYPYKMVLNLKNSMTTLSVIHAAPPPRAAYCRS